MSRSNPSTLPLVITMSIDPRWLLPLLLLCATPAHADAFPPGHKFATPPVQISKLAPGDPLGYQPAPSPPTLGITPDRLYDDPIASRVLRTPAWLPGTGSVEGWNIPIIYASNRGGNNNGGNQQNGGNGGGNNGCGNGNGGPNGSNNCGGGGGDRPKPDSSNDVPGPFPILGAAAAFGWSRKLRRRIKA